MTKVVIFNVLLLLSSAAYSRRCEVYGISDSPQKLSCLFRNERISLQCVNGDYFLNNSQVSMAYHLEVEEGPTPLVFRAPDMQLTATLGISATLDRGGRILKGSCR